MMEPCDGTKPRSAFRRTLFPAPFGPMIASASPFRTENEISSRTDSPSSTTETPETCNTGSFIKVKTECLKINFPAIHADPFLLQHRHLLFGTAIKSSDAAT